MFNEVSRAAVRDFLIESPEFSCLIPLYDLLYSTPNKCYYFDDKNELQYFLQQEGHAQGCPIAPTMSVFNLCLLLKLVTEVLKARAQARLQNSQVGDDGRGTVGSALEYVDDSSLFLHPSYIIPVLETFQEQGKPLGIQLNFSKTKLLTSTTGTPSTNPIIQEALAYINAQAGKDVQPEITTGVRFLGQPIGSDAFATSFLTQASKKYSTNLSKLLNSSTDLHTKFLLFHSCAIPSVQHLLTADVYHHCQVQDATTIDPFHWQSTFQTSTTQANHKFIAQLASVHALPPHTLHILQHPVSSGGLGTRNNILSTIPAFIVSTTQSLRYATAGIPTADNQIITIPPTLGLSLHGKNLLLRSLFSTFTPSWLPYFFPSTMLPSHLTPTFTPPPPLSLSPISLHLAGLASSIYKQTLPLVFGSIP
ncbi:hypothetical protein SEMRO_1672_G290141.1 [Seminavis robusta]|uniref:Reverse transcriptase domain-containing protein n=1 Tax=Seminavis robusta TaxID=568900 RepID=A0A9N8ES29_9STRA|nr:hypothetical protein SEMRO_1672_G290141.1 [Seminavis robusta]|eukprot:Sro1672_g290141.1  (421) ;mRNA; f:11124-12386